MAFPFNSTGSLSPTFVSARYVYLPVKLPSAFTLFCAISVRTEGTFGRLRYSLGGYRPSKTDRLTRSSGRIHGSGLDPPVSKGGVSLMTPTPPKGRLQRLPLTLSIKTEETMTAYS